LGGKKVERKKGREFDRLTKGRDCPAGKRSGVGGCVAWAAVIPDEKKEKTIC